MDGIERFTDKSKVYDRYRPEYPKESKMKDSVF